MIIRPTLEAADCLITSLEWIKPTLEDVFISATIGTTRTADWNDLG